MTHLFSPLSLYEIELCNRIVMSPMCMYSASKDGIATEWHRVHYGTRAVGGAGLLLLEATAVEARGRISESDLGLWDDTQVAPLAEIVRFCKEQGAAMGVQLAHAGRKAWSHNRGQGPERPVAPSALPHDDEWTTPHALLPSEIDEVVSAFTDAAERASAAGFDLVEIHAAHGYLLHEFLSPLSNQRDDEYGGSLRNRGRLLLQVVDAVRKVWPDGKPIFVRVSATDWAEGGLTVDDHVQIARWLKEHGVDVVDCSTGGITAPDSDAIGPGYQVTYARRIKHKANIKTQTVGLITKPEHADAIVRNGRADLVALGRELLRHPYWPLEAAHRLGHDVSWPQQYERAKGFS